PQGAGDRSGAGSGASEGAQRREEGRREGRDATGSAEDPGGTDGTDDTAGADRGSAPRTAQSKDANANTGGTGKSPDQPTAVFRAPRPAAPPVDQPT
ncbi:D-alanyl-D-alanine carboxypeptidase, partial [Streptomyces sp. TRM76130]|nr:D-alanyl-D-alanine carboxypeptidase [Streptomyces sp. TRM76130]